MKILGKFIGANYSLDGKLTIAFEVTNKGEVLNYLSKYKTTDLLEIAVKKFRKKRSLDANALLWACRSHRHRQMGRISDAPEALWTVHIHLRERV